MEGLLYPSTSQRGCQAILPVRGTKGRSEVICPLCSGQLFDQRLIPKTTQVALDAYVFERRQPGDFLLAVLSNNLRDAFQRADSENLSALPAIVSYVYNHTPALCQGSPKRVQEWLLRREPM